MFTFNTAEIADLIDALERAAARHESQARALVPGSYFAGEHDRKAARMRKLHLKLKRINAEVRPVELEIVS